MAVIKEKDAIRLGLIADPARMSQSDRKPTRAAQQLAALSKPKRRSAKGGRILKATEQAPFKVSFFIPLEPKTKERPRTSLSKPAIEKAFMQAGGSIDRFRGLLASIKHQTYTPDDTSAFEASVAMIASTQMRGNREPYAGPVHVDCVFVMTGEDGQWPTDVTDPDLDNMEKAICDALNKVVWKDDRMMVSKRSIKICGPRTGVAVVVRDAASVASDLLSLAMLGH